LVIIETISAGLVYSVYTLVIRDYANLVQWHCINWSLVEHC